MNTPLLYVTNAAQLQQALQDLHAATVVAFDLEFDRDRYTYGFDLCLIQMATPEACFVIDPLAGLDLKPLYQFFETPGIRKLVHCPGEDLRLLHSLACYPTDLVDTELYAKLLNYEQTSLSNLLQLKCDVQLNKKLQTSNWGKRPLSDGQLHYAAADVIYLFELENILQQEATEKGLMPFVAEEFAQLNTVRYTLEARQNFLKKNDLQFMSPYDQYVLNELLRFRDDLARQKNKPAHQIIPEELVRQIAYRKMEPADILSQHGVHPILKSDRGVYMLEQQWKKINAAAHAQQLPRRRNGQPLSEEDRLRFEQKKLAQENAKAHIFQPIQQAIAAKYGEHAQKFLMSSSLVNDWLKGDQRINQLKLNYRKQLIQDVAQEIGVDITAWM
ncbi:ribonuclease D [Phnomibacter ginsenosidimutans]|uniref:3'-5' exonuclease domain-containing protein n=1 Tax=Phnomibacter ginsenosidimutans TaxID=2676868 RepID=A0A6I6GA99_9BACT|nr:ribonuclease D [Phnomibacter ginsenosidimutans]QGW29756.1 hypothetical protein GLV81_17990 [Phnomibacter ginsenosidimutans]